MLIEYLLKFGTERLNNLISSLLDAIPSTDYDAHLMINSLGNIIDAAKHGFLNDLLIIQTIIEQYNLQSLIYL